MAKQLVDLNMMMILAFSAHKVIMLILMIGVFSSHEVCPIAFSEELTYWGISELFVEPCCQELYYGRGEQLVIVLMSSQT